MAWQGDTILASCLGILRCLFSCPKVDPYDPSSENWWGWYFATTCDVFTKCTYTRCILEKQSVKNKENYERWKWISNGAD